MNTTLKGNTLEQAIYDFFSKQIAEAQIPWKKECCKVFRQKGYYSKDRDGHIKFDVSIEFFMPGAPEYSQVWLIECKNYSGSVPVSDVEEFFTKVQQVAAANSKAIIVSGAAFDPGGVNFARSKQMSVLRYFDASHVKWELYRSPSATTRSSEEGSNNRGVMEGITSQNFKSNVFDLYIQHPGGLTNSLWDFVISLLATAALSDLQLDEMRNSSRRPASSVPFITQDELENRSVALLGDIGYRDGAVSLEDICAREATRCGLNVMRDVSRPIEAGYELKLGQISFAPAEILVYEHTPRNLGRERFTLAHELAHHLLSHGQFMSAESCDEGDFSLLRDGKALGPDIARMEYQANVFASCLLMPKHSFMENFRRITSWLGIPNRGFGELYLDDQNCNHQNYMKVTNELMAYYDVSRTATSIRLSSLGLLRDVRSQSESPS